MSAIQAWSPALDRMVACSGTLGTEKRGEAMISFYRSSSL
jgi:hypothetical protein